jgi:hypothetical protein
MLYFDVGARISKKCSIFAVDLIKVILTTKTQKTMAKQTKKQNIVVLFNNYDNYDFEEYKKDYIENNEIDGDVSDQTIWDYISYLEQIDWAEMMSLLDKVWDYNKCIINGTAGTWQGRRECGQVYDTLQDAVYAITQNCDYVKVWCENGHLYVQASHHDGTHNMEIKLFTKKGNDTYNNWLWSCCGASLDSKSRYEVLETLFDNNFFSRLPRVEKYF